MYIAGVAADLIDIAALVNSLTAVIYENRLFLPPGVMLLLRMLGEQWLQCRADERVTLE